MPREAPTNSWSWGKGVCQLPPGKLASQSNKLFFFFFNKIYLFVYLAAPDLSYSMRDLFPDQELNPGPQHLEVWSLSHWTTREVLNNFFIKPLRVTGSPL